MSQFHVAPQQRAILVAGGEDLPVRIPTARPVDIAGKRLWGVPFNVRECMQLRQIGYKVPSPIGYYYDWPRELSKVPQPFENQRETAAFFTLFHRAYCLNEIGTGKTLAALWAADYLMKVGMVRKCLIVSTISTLDRVWGDAVFEHLRHRSIAILHGTAERRKRLFANDAFDFYAINHDAVDIIAALHFQEKRVVVGAEGPLPKKLIDVRLLRDDVDLVIIDEIAAFRNQQNRRWRIMNMALRPNQWAWGMTGSPTPQAPSDAYGQVKLLTPNRVPDYYTTFRQMTMQKMTEYIWVPRKEATQVVFDAMQPAIRYTRDECYDLPPCLYSERDVPLTPTQQKHYKEVAKELYTEIDGGKITAVNEGVKVSKLLQIACGVVYDKEGKERLVDAEPRIAEVRSIIEQSAHKVIVFVPFTSVLKLLYEKLMHKNELGHGEMVYGGTSKTERGRIFMEFQKRSDLRWLVADAQTMAHGLTLTEASTVVWYAPEYSNEIYEQANGRITRAGQKNNQYIIHLAATAGERRLYARLRERGTLQGILLDMVQDGMAL